MTFDLGTLRVNTLIVHEVPKRMVREATDGLSLSEIESPLTTELRNHFRERIATTLHAAAYDVVADPGVVSPVPQLITDYLLGRRVDIVEASQAMARHLHQCQTGVSPEGLLVVADAQLADTRALSILKLEREAGIRVHPAKVRGKTTFTVEHLQDLMLTQKTRVFKASLFTQPGRETTDLVGSVSDSQLGYQPRTVVADFFLRRFLGCAVTQRPEVLTKEFFALSEEFINTHVKDAAEKAHYHVALLAELQSNASSLHPARFADQHFGVADRQPFVAFLRSRGFPARIFEKDVSLVRSHIKRTVVDFRSGVAILAPPEAFEEHVTMKRLADGRSRVEVVDHVATVHGRK
jgi:hypothetical protein